MDKAHITPGLYRHYKGQNYVVLGTARHSETEEIMVLYRMDYGNKNHWVRPLSMFEEMIDIEGSMVPRFKLIEAH